MNLLAEKLRRKRMEKGLQQKDMALGLKISTAAYSKIESGITNISLDLTKRIADMLQIPIAELMENKLGNIEIKNGDNCNIVMEHGNLIMQNEKLTEALVNANKNQTKLTEQMIGIMQNQNELFKEVLKVAKSR